MSDFFINLTKNVIGAIDFSFNFWSNLFSLIGIVAGALITLWISRLSKQLSAREKHEHEKRITKELESIPIYSEVILADVKKYHPLRTDTTNSTYYKQGAQLYRVIPEFGIQFILRPSDENIPTGLVPFEWVAYTRDYDSEDTKPIIVCKFKGVRWYEKYKSPFKEISYIYNNPKYKEGLEPKFLKFTEIKPDQILDQKL